MSEVETIVVREAWIYMMGRDLLTMMIVLSRRLGVPVNELYSEWRSIEMSVSQTFEQEYKALSDEADSIRKARR